jgi:hypothetical protein
MFDTANHQEVDADHDAEGKEQDHSIGPVGAVRREPPDPASLMVARLLALLPKS